LFLTLGVRATLIIERNPVHERKLAANPVSMRNGSPGKGVEDVVPVPGNLEAGDQGGSIEELANFEKDFWRDIEHVGDVTKEGWMKINEDERERRKEKKITVQYLNFKHGKGYESC
jgi:hypothetical protein